MKGKIKEAAGVLTDNRRLQAEGRLEKTEGRAQEKIGELKRDLQESSNRHTDEDI
ncbi:MAG: CsbD family protein [Crenarchaeota archaeon]|nr:CsbD family protein [Thermoproteota archaeon]